MSVSVCFVLNSTLPSQGEASSQSSLCLVSGVLQRCDFGVSRPTWVDCKADVLTALQCSVAHSCHHVPYREHVPALDRAAHPELTPLEAGAGRDAEAPTTLSSMGTSCPGCS